MNSEQAGLWGFVAAIQGENGQKPRWVHLVLLHLCAPSPPLFDFMPVLEEMFFFSAKNCKTQTPQHNNNVKGPLLQCYM